MKFSLSTAAAHHRIAAAGDENTCPDEDDDLHRGAGIRGGRLVVPPSVLHAGDASTKIIRDISAEQPSKRAATLEDVARSVAPNRMNTIVVGGSAVA